MREPSSGSTQSGISFGTMDAERRAATGGDCDGNGCDGGAYDDGAYDDPLGAAEATLRHGEVERIVAYGAGENFDKMSHT